MMRNWVWISWCCCKIWLIHLRNSADSSEKWKWWRWTLFMTLHAESYCKVLLYCSSLQFSNKSRLFSSKDRRWRWDGAKSFGRGRTHPSPGKDAWSSDGPSSLVSPPRLPCCPWQACPTPWPDNNPCVFSSTSCCGMSLTCPPEGPWLNPEDWLISKGIFRSRFSILTSTSRSGVFVLKDKSAWKTRCQLPGALRFPSNRKQWRHTSVSLFLQSLASSSFPQVDLFLWLQSAPCCLISQ